MGLIDRCVFFLLLTCAWVKSTLRFLRCVKGNCIGFESETLQPAKLPILLICPIDPPAEPKP